MDASVINLFPAIRGAYREHRRSRQIQQQPEPGVHTPSPAYAPNAQNDLPHAFSVPLRIKFVQVSHFTTDFRTRMARKVNDSVIINEAMRYEYVLDILRDKMARLGVRGGDASFVAKSKGAFMGIGGREESVTERNWMDVVSALRSGYFETLELICE